MILYLLNLADLVSTLLTLSLGWVELNPVINYIMSIHPSLFPLVKFIPAYFLCEWLERNAKKSSAAMKRYITVVCIYAAVVIWNILNIATTVV